MQSPQWKSGGAPGRHLVLRRRVVVPLSALVLLPVAITACEDRPKAGPVLSPMTLDQVVTWVDEITLEETPEVINVNPQVRTDTEGRFLVADPREAQIRIYAADGQLNRHFGSKGDGPREFRSLTAAVRMPSAAILATDFSGKIAIFDSTGTNVIYSGRSPVGPIFDVEPLSDTLVLLGGRMPGKRKAPILHMWRPGSDLLLHSFFIPPVPADLETEALTVGGVDAAIRGDTVAAVFSSIDTIYLFSPDGTPRGKIAIPFRNFRLPVTKMPSRPTSEEFAEWLESFSLISRLFWMEDGSFLVQYVDRADTESLWRLLHMTRDGKPIFELKDTPRLLAADEDRRLYFVKPTSLTPNKWSIATLAH